MSYDIEAPDPMNPRAPAMIQSGGTRYPLLAADLDGNGVMDLVTQEVATLTVRVMTYSSSTLSGLTVVAGDWLAGGRPPRGDLDGDGVPELIHPTADPRVDRFTCPRRIYVTDGGLPPPFTMADADAFCNSATNHPGGEYRALLMSSARRACVSPDCTPTADPLDWVMRPFTQYMNDDGDFMFESNADAIYTAYPMSATLGGAGRNMWTGATDAWEVKGTTCMDWMTGSGAVFGGVGWDAASGSGWIQGGNFRCDAAAPLLCVQQ